MRFFCSKMRFCAMCLLFKPFHFFLQDCVCCQLFFRYSPQKNTERSSATWRKLSNSNTLLPWDFKNHIFCTMKKETEIQKFFPFLVSFLNVWKYKKKLGFSHLQLFVYILAKKFNCLFIFLVWRMSAVCLDLWTRTFICCHLHFGAKIQVFHSHNWKMSLFWGDFQTLCHSVSFI